jgi:hypothetical protein
MATGTGIGLVNLGKTESCKKITYHFSMGIGRMRQIATKVVNPDTVAAADAAMTNQVTGQAVVVTTAKQSELRSQKRLIDSPELDEIRSQDSKLKSVIERTSAYAGESSRFILSTEVVRMWKMLEAYRTLRRPQLVAAFMARYRELEAVEFAPLAEVLGDQFDRTDYKPADVVEAGFDFWYTIHDVGVISLTGLPSEIVEQEKQKEREQRAESVAEFKIALRFTFKKLVDTLFDTVKPQPDGKKRKFFDSSVENLLEFVTNYAKQDMADDVETQQHIANVRRILKGVTPATLKESDNQKAYVAAQLAAVKEAVGALVQETGRKFR